MTPELRAQFIRRATQIGMRPACREFGISAGRAAGVIYRARNPRDGRAPLATIIQRERIPPIYVKNVNIPVDEDMYARVDRLAKRDGVPKAQIGRELLEWALERFGDE